MLVLRRFGKLLPTVIPYYVKLVGLPPENWEDLLEGLVKDFRLQVHESNSYLCLETESHAEAEKLRNHLHGLKVEDKYTLRACHLIGEDEETWNHKLFHVRPDFAIDPEPITESLAAQIDAEADEPAEELPDEQPSSQISPEEDENPQETLKELIQNNPPRVF